MKKRQDVTKTWVGVLIAAKDHHDELVEQKLIDVERTRLTIAARQEEVKRLIASGVSQRKTGKIVGVGRSTVQRDLARNESKSGPKRATKAEKRAAREVELAAKQIALPEKRYGVIVADPEWRFEPYSRETGMDRAADNHYPTSPTDTIASRPIQDIAADDCVLFLWATAPMLLDALAVMARWGFEYKSHLIWDKVLIGTGYWARNRHELLLIGTRGDVPAPAMGDQVDSILAFGRKEHSAKPEQFLELIESYFPTLPKIELNRRGQARPGWDAWGNEFLEAAE